MGENDSNSKENTLNAEFERFCQLCALPSDVKTRAWNVWRDFASKSEDAESTADKQAWFTVATYTAVVDSSMPYGPDDPHLSKQSPPCLTLTDLLKKAQMNVIEFIEKMRCLREELVLSEAVRLHLTNVEKKYCIVSPLFNRFDREWGTVFREDDNDKRCDVVIPFSQPEGPQYRKRLCWTLFLHAKEHLCGESHELVHCYHLLLACLEFVLRTTPSFQLQQPFDLLRQHSTENLDQTGYNTAILEKLAEHFHTSLEDLQAIHTMTEGFFQSLKNRAGDVDLTQLQTSYHERYLTEGDLDELQFLQHEAHLMPEHSKPSTTTSVLPKMETPVTPVRAAMNTVQQLKNILASSKDEPCPELLKYFKNCSSSPASSIATRLSELQARFVERYRRGGRPGTSMAHQRWRQATRLYYRVMKTLLDMEKERLSQSDFSSLLNNDTFHRSLLACSIEIVLVTYNVAWNPSRGGIGAEDSQFRFPWVLEVFSLYPYEFYKVLESFIKAEPNLTKDIIKHLTVIEHKILDCIAWSSDSPVFEAITATESSSLNVNSPAGDAQNGQGASSAAELSLLDLSLQDHSCHEEYISPMRGQTTRGANPNCVVFVSPRKAQSVSAAYTKESPEPKAGGGGGSGGGPHRSHSLSLFFNKVCRLGYHRLKALCEMLKVPKDVQQKIWTCLEFCILYKPDLMKNRHLDQIMMCSIYAICKVSDSEIKFKDIVRDYGRLPHAEAQTYKQVLIEDGETDSIIMFYNRVYMHSMKNFILQFAKPVQPNLSPAPGPVHSPVYSIPGRKNFYVSPLRESPFKSPQSPGNMTPRSRQLYSFGEGIGSAEKLKNINESVSAFNRRQPPYVSAPKGLKRLSFDNLDEPNQNSLTSGHEEDGSIVVKKKRVTPPAVVKKSANSGRKTNGTSSP